MIVICTKCQAKFRVADDKIGARGAKVRCSKCQTVFLVRPEGASPPAGGLEGRAPAPPVGSPFAPAAVPSAAAIAPPPFPPADVPSAAAGVASLPAPLPDPFAPSAAASPDPFAPSAAPSADPFAPAAPQDPFAAPPAGADPFAAPSADPFAAPAADPFAAPPAHADVGALLGQAAVAVPDAAAALGEAPEADPDDVQSVTSGLALEERSATPPKPASSAPFDLANDAGYDGFAAGAQAFDPSALDLGGAPSDAPALATDGKDAAALAPATPAAPSAPVLARGATAPAPNAAPEPTIPEPQAHVHERIPGRPSRLRGVAVNALALAAVLVAAIVILALWRSHGPIEAASLRPSAVLAALRDGGAEAPFAARDVRSGLYERERAPPVLFVRGSVVSHAPAPVARVQVRVEVVRGGAVVARGEAIAGAVPTPEELWAARDAAALAAVTTAAAGRAPAAIRPGDAVPFLVAIADQPADLAGASLRVEAAPSGSAAP